MPTKHGAATYALHELQRSLPSHVAFNVALLIRRLRPVFQLDFQSRDERHESQVVAQLKKRSLVAKTLTHGTGILVWMSNSRVRHAVSRAGPLGPYEPADIAFGLWSSRVA